MTNAKNSNWQNAGDDVLSVCLCDENAWETAHLKQGLMPAHLATLEQREIYQAIIALRKQGKKLVDTLIRDLCGSSVTVEKIALLIAMSDEYRIDAFKDNVNLVRDYGLAHKTTEFLQLASNKIKGGAGWKDTADKVVKMLTSLGNTTDIGDVSAKAHSEAFDAILDSAPAESIRTYIPFFEEHLYGIPRGKFIGIVAPYKSRKTTVALNVIVGAIMGAYLSGNPMPSIAFMSGEMLANEISANIVAMIAMALIKQRGLYLHKDVNDYPHSILSGGALIQFGRGYKHWHADKVKAIDDARHLYREAFGDSLRIYDKRPANGGINTIEKLESAMRRDMALFKPDVVLIDYLQVFGTNAQRDDDFERLRITSSLCQDFVKTTGASIIGLAQMNEVGVNGGDGYSAHVKGGGSLSQNVDVLIQSFYKMPDLIEDLQLKLVIKLGRAVGNAETVLNINPSSGLLLDSRWIEKLGSGEVF